MGALIKGVHIDEIYIDWKDDEEEQPEPELSENLAGTSQEPTQEEPKKEEPKKAAPRKPAKEIDKGKVGALYKAGWSVPKIADEMKVSAPTIRKALKEMGLWT